MVLHIVNRNKIILMILLEIESGHCNLYYLLSGTEPKKVVLPTATSETPTTWSRVCMITFVLFSVLTSIVLCTHYYIDLNAMYGKLCLLCDITFSYMLFSLTLLLQR